MTVPTFPTDNLYKFVSIFGLLLLLYGLITPFFVLTKNLETIETIAVEAAEISAKIELLSQILEIDPPKKGDKKRAREFLEGSVELKAKSAALGVKKDIVHRLNDQNLFIIIISVLVSLVGVAMSGAGFYLWYTRVQKFEDLAVKSKITPNNSSKKDAQKTRASS